MLIYNVLRICTLAYMFALLTHEFAKRFPSNKALYVFTDHHYSDIVGI